MNLPKSYEAKKYESDIYDLWLKSGVFKANPNSSKEHYSISMPPPNETGTLHIGHALFITLQDILIRHARQKGKDALWLPGTDHAAIATNAIIEKKLEEKGTNKHKVGREKFLNVTREFVGSSRDTINEQLRAMGASCDWSRARYTLDDTLNRCVNEVFVKMYNDGLIYRGNRIVNWDPKLETNVSDDEVEHQEVKGKFYYFKYGPFEIGTARPETKFGDKYVVMNPKDKRYKKYKQGDTFEAEWINGKVTATVIKDEAVDPTFGTGVMTITPWHDQTDFYIAEKHKLDKEQIIDLKGRLLPIAGEFADMTIEEVRPKVVEKLRSKGLLSRVEENYTHSIALNSRGKGIIEPQIRLQWFIDVNKKVVNWKNKKLSLKEVMQSVIREGDIKLIPSRYEKNYFHWVDNLRDWCISRQIWWGHRIPVWYRTDTDGRHETYVGVIPPTDQNEGRHEWEQDHDTLDTWFSSALWTWSTLIDQELANDYKLSLDTLLKKSLDFQTYHPTTVMETGWDILYFWVTRMILATTYVTGEIPFKKVYLHGLVRTEAGQKMSKSHPDTIIDPLEVIPEYGTDALRLALVQGMSAGNDQRLGISKIITNRNFCNKLWNIARFVESTPKNSDDEIKLSTIYDHWIIDRLNECQESIKTDLDKFLFSEAYDKIYHFIWHDFADWYVEASKDSPNSILLSYVLKQSLVLIHPFAPFISEAIWQTINNSDKSLLASETFTSLIKYELAKANQFEIVKSVISESRYLQKVLNAKKPAMNYQKSQLITDNIKMIKRLAYLKDIKEVSKGQGIKLTLVKENIWLDIDKSKTVIYLKDVSEKNKIQEKIVSNLKNRLSNKKYLTSAPEDIIIQTKDQLSVAEEVLLNLQNEIKRFKS